MLLLLWESSRIRWDVSEAKQVNSACFEARVLIIHTLILSVMGSATPYGPLSEKYGCDENVKVVACPVRTMIQRSSVTRLNELECFTIARKTEYSLAIRSEAQFYDLLERT